MGSCISALTTMGRFLPFLCLLGLALSGPVVDQETDKMVHEMGDVIEAGLIEPSHGDARALFISLTLTSTSTSLATATVTSTVTASCWTPSSGTLSACTTTTTTTTTTAAAAGRRKRMVHMNRRDEFMDTIDDYMQDARVTLDGKEVDISMILPTSTHARERSDLEDEAPTMYTNLDAPGLQSGGMEWSEVAVDSTAGLGSNCGRSDHSHEKRPRIIMLQNTVLTKNFTTTSTVLVTASTTRTFQVTATTSPSFTNTAFTACTATTG